MKELQDRILKDGLVIGTDILKVNKFINHQVDPVLMEDIGKEFATHFKDKAITKVVTIESSGIAPALMTAIEMGAAQNPSEYRCALPCQEKCRCHRDAAEHPQHA